MPFIIAPVTYLFEYGFFLLNSEKQTTPILSPDMPTPTCKKINAVCLVAYSWWQHLIKSSTTFFLRLRNEKDEANDKADKIDQELKTTKDAVHQAQSDCDDLNRKVTMKWSNSSSSIECWIIMSESGTAQLLMVALPEWNHL